MFFAPKLPPDDKMPELDEHHMQEWITFGLRQVEQSLRNHAKFDEFYKQMHNNEEDPLD